MTSYFCSNWKISVEKCFPCEGNTDKFEYSKKSRLNVGICNYSILSNRLLFTTVRVFHSFGFRCEKNLAGIHRRRMLANKDWMLNPVRSAAQSLCGASRATSKHFFHQVCSNWTCFFRSTSLPLASNTVIQFGSIGIIRPLSTALSSATNKSQQHQEKNSWERWESNTWMRSLCATKPPNVLDLFWHSCFLVRIFRDTPSDEGK